MRNSAALGPSAVSSFVRGEVARALRSRRPYTVNLLLGGVDPITGLPSLYWIDYLASCAKVPYAAHGYAQWVFNTFTLSCPLTDIDITVYLCWTNIITLISTLSGVWKFSKCVLTN
jgi:hypothetical protein